VKRFVGSLVLSLTWILTGCAPVTIPTSTSVSQIPQTKDIKELVWNQLLPQSKAEIIGSWQNAKVEKIRVQGHPFENAEKYVGQELLRISFESRSNPTLGPVTVFADPHTQQILGYGFRD
jgi:hypothetical protein